MSQFCLMKKQNLWKSQQFLWCLCFTREKIWKHNTFWREVAKRFLRLAKEKNAFIITDEEAAIISAMTQNLPLIEIYRCWNHVLQNANMQLRKFGFKSNVEVSEYLDDKRQLFSQSDNQKYNDLLLEFCTSWSKVYIKSFDPVNIYS